MDYTVSEQYAREALREMGITPTRQLIENWMRAERAEEAEVEQPAETIRQVSASNQLDRQSQAEAPTPRQTPSSKSRLEPVLREQGTLEKPVGRRKRGRPRIIASWFPAVAASMADGTSLKTALAMNGLNLSKGEVRACYRNKTLKAIYTEARRVYLAEHYGRKPTLRANIGRYM
jgi:hypothetical protein